MHLDKRMDLGVDRRVHHSLFPPKKNRVSVIILIIIKRSRYAYSRERVRCT